MFSELLFEISSFSLRFINVLLTYFGALLVRLIEQIHQYIESFIHHWRLKHEPADGLVRHFVLQKIYKLIPLSHLVVFLGGNWPVHRVECNHFISKDVVEFGQFLILCIFCNLVIVLLCKLFLIFIIIRKFLLLSPLLTVYLVLQFLLKLLL